MSKQKILAWCVHFYTSLGLVAAAGMALFIVRGRTEGFRWVIALMIAATFIDATDGTLARRWRVKEVLPNFDGGTLDNIVDFLNYTFLPLLFVWRTGVLPDYLCWFLLLPLLASAYGFSQTRAKTEDHFFLGFPSYWNVVAIYLYWLRLPVWLSLPLIALLALLTFVPSLYLYTSYRGRFSRLTNWLLLGWAVLLIVILAEITPNALLVWVSLAFPFYYFVLSWVITIGRWTRKEDWVGKKGEEARSKS